MRKVNEIIGKVETLIGELEVAASDSFTLAERYKKQINELAIAREDELAESARARRVATKITKLIK